MYRQGLPSAPKRSAARAHRVPDTTLPVGDQTAGALDETSEPRQDRDDSVGAVRRAAELLEDGGLDPHELTDDRWESDERSDDET
jgi:hypothetical protein